MKKLLLLLLLMSGNAWADADKCLQEKIFFQCLEAAVKISDHDSKHAPEIIKECEDVSRKIAQRNIEKTISRECNGQIY